MSAGIDRSSPLPFYYQLKQILLADLRARDLAPGTRLPGDNELCGTYDVSRTVVRQALAELETEGVIERQKGRGTFVAHRRTAERLVQSLTGLYEDVAARGGHLRSDVRRQEVVPADGQIADQLQLSRGAPVVVIERLRFVDDEPWVLATTYLPYDIAPGLVHDDLSDQSLYAPARSVLRGAAHPWAAGGRGGRSPPTCRRRPGDQPRRAGPGAAQPVVRRRPAGRDVRGLPPRRPQPLRGHPAAVAGRPVNGAADARHGLSAAVPG